MLKTDLIEIVNKGGVWAFIGTGPSIDSGLPSWEKLIDETVESYDAKTKQKILQDSKFKADLKIKNYKSCFSIIEYHSKREILEEKIKEKLTIRKTPGQLIKNICDWPFAGYITTNYDTLIEDTLSLGNSRDHGWASVGNTKDELLKISGDVEKIVWHIHGAVHLPKESSKFILTEKDYDWLYSNNNGTLECLRALLLQKRVVFLGFGFSDDEVKRQLRLIGSKYLNPARPAYAFLSDLAGSKNRYERENLRKNYNINVIPYTTTESGSHEKLIELIKIHGSMILRTSLKLNQPTHYCPSYDPETTGLLIYNNLCLKGEAVVTDDILNVLLKSRILSLIQHEKIKITEDLIQDLLSRINVIRGKHGAAIQPEASTQVKNTLEELIKLDLIIIENKYIKLTKNGQALTADHAAQATLLEDRFTNSLISRTSALIEDGKSAEMVGKIAKTFIKECIEDRSLGVAMAMFSSTSNHQEYHMVALLQRLPEFLSQVANENEAKALVKIVQLLFSSPNEEERKYIGLLLQAKFGSHLLGYDKATLQARARDFSNTLFLMDSSTLIPFLATSSIAHSSANLLINGIQSFNSFVATTKQLALEVAEHARWAYDKIKTDQGKLGIESLKSLTGHTTKRENVFLQGFINMVTSGQIIPDFDLYMDKIFASNKKNYTKDQDVEDLLQKKNIKCAEFSEWEGFSESLFAECDEVSKKIKSEREKKATYKHDRQVDAEAKAFLIIKNLRNKTFKVNGSEVKSAYFISNTRIIDELKRLSSAPITVRPEVALQWITTLKPCKLDEMEFFTNALLRELSQIGCSIINYDQLRIIFGPLINASKEKLEEELIRHHDLIAQHYGEESIKAFHDIDPIDAPIVLQGLSAQINESILKQLEETTKAKEAAEASAEVPEKEKKRFFRWKARKEEKQRKQSFFKKKKKKKKKKKRKR